MKVIDLYAGVGGWAVGFKLAGFEVSRSYEWWSPAARTHQNNSNTPVEIADIRSLQVSELPTDIDIVVGSPPCTQFSYSNRGGSGDIADGLIDIAQFLKVVRHVKPKAWAFENVPRVKQVLERELAQGGELEEFSDLFSDAQIEVFDMADFGLPQRRKRCIAGNFDFELLRSYSFVTDRPTLGDVIFSLSTSSDPIYSSTGVSEVFDNEAEEPLNWEEERFNRDMKVAHPVYNGMPFPDPLERSSRTVTATCTRVSRESLVVHDATLDGFRRLSVRERASLQGFPASFQFLGRSHAEKLKMIGNAIPPIFTYLVAEAIKGTKATNLVRPKQIAANLSYGQSKRQATKPDISGRTYPDSRRFRFSIPNLRFKSGTRFELSNIDGPKDWMIGFYFGDSKRINRRNFTKEIVSEASSWVSQTLHETVSSSISRIAHQLNVPEPENLQASWVHKAEGYHPFNFLDKLGVVAQHEMASDEWSAVDEAELKDYVFRLLYTDKNTVQLAEKKVERYLLEISVGSVIAAAVNLQLGGAHEDEKQVAELFEN
ncbi:DNA cytosine methyltransferase [Ruegeria arenilitoris]|uniref:DNA cytosine methyltransferase n=1 Tax=Ruegeria arenilitoris TaxID=1173585 RepID=UPI003C7C8B31